MNRAVPAVALLLAAALLLLLAAVPFVRQMQSAPDATRADGIVVLTGGADRVATGLRLLAEGRGRILLVSGVGGAAAFPALAREAGADAALASRVTLGRAAATTYGNALETAAWTRAQGLRSLLVVTAWYHMPRALAELGRALPGVALHAVPVQPASGAPWRLVAAEYVKFLGARLGASALLARLAPAETTQSAGAAVPQGGG